jgi:hypothetical protein
MSLENTRRYAPTLQGQLLKLYNEVPNPELRRRIAKNLVRAYFAPNLDKDPDGDRVFYIENCYWFTLPTLQATADNS